MEFALTIPYSYVNDTCNHTKSDISSRCVMLITLTSS